MEETKVSPNTIFVYSCPPNDYTLDVNPVVKECFARFDKKVRPSDGKLILPEILIGWVPGEKGLWEA